MTDTYRAKYHKRPAYMKAEDHASSGESDAEVRGLPLPVVRSSEPLKSRSEPGILQHSILLPMPYIRFVYYFLALLWMLIYSKVFVLQAIRPRRLLQSGIQWLQKDSMSMVSYDFFTKASNRRRLDAKRSRPALWAAAQLDSFKLGLEFAYELEHNRKLDLNWVPKRL